MIVLVDADPVELPCSRCKGEGWRGDMECGGCSGSGSDWFDRSELFTLAHNLAIGGALMIAGLYAEMRITRGVDWLPGCGRKAPGWEGQ